MKVVLASLVAVVFVGISEAVVCKTNADCGAGECCYIQPEFLVASKRRQLVLPQLHQHHDTGVCEAYHIQDAPCYPLETANGHCGCTPGTQCQWVPDATTSASAGKRSMIFHPEPGSYRCVTI